MCTEGPSVASEKWLLAAESETNAEEKKGVSVGDCAPYEAVIWGLSLQAISAPSGRSLSHSHTPGPRHRAPRRSLSEPLDSCHGGWPQLSDSLSPFTRWPLSARVNGDKVPSPDPGDQPDTGISERPRPTRRFSSDTSSRSRNLYL